MSRFDFMRKLESLLSDIPLEERNEALKYYNDYFDDAGVDNEENIINELGTPERIVGIIKAELRAERSSGQDRGVFTEKGYKDTVYEEKKFEVIKPQERQERAEQNSNNNANLILIILICIFALPVGIPLFFTVLGLIIAAIAVVVSLLFGFGIIGIALVPSGIAMIFAGLVKMGIPTIGLSLCGGGLVLLGLGVLFVMLSVWLCKTLLPAIIKGIVNICRLPFKNRSVSA